MVSIRAGAALSALLLLLLSSASFAFAGAARPTVVVADFDYSDTSGEVIDQRADHARRIAAFSADLVATLADKGHLDIRRVPCGRNDCSVEALGPDRLIAAAKASGARYLVYGGVHKASTLVEFLKIDMLDLHAEKVVASKIVTFRGDNDEAFKRAAVFLADDLLQGVALPPS